MTLDLKKIDILMILGLPVHEWGYLYIYLDL